MTEEKQFARKFQGELVGHKAVARDDSEGRFLRDFHKRHLKAYLKGDTRFHIGQDEDGDPIWFNVHVKQEPKKALQQAAEKYYAAMAATAEEQTTNKEVTKQESE